MTTYEQLKEIIVKAVPEIMDLKFGCKFIIKKDSKYYKDVFREKVCIITSSFEEWEALKFEFMDPHINRFQHFNDGKHPPDKDWKVETENQRLADIFPADTYDIYESRPDDVIEILGRDISVEDVLATLDKASRFIFIGVTGKIYRDNYGELVNTDVFWQLGKPLHLQSEETIEFLLNLLKKQP